MNHIEKAVEQCIEMMLSSIGLNPRAVMYSQALYLPGAAECSENIKNENVEQITWCLIIEYIATKARFII